MRVLGPLLLSSISLASYNVCDLKDSKRIADEICKAKQCSVCESGTYPIGSCEALGNYLGRKDAKCKKKCNKGEAKIAECTSGSCCASGLKAETKKAKGLLAWVKDLFVTPAEACHSVPGINYGIRDGQNQSGVGRQIAACARTDVCFGNGHVDACANAGWDNLACFSNCTGFNLCTSSECRDRCDGCCCADGNCLNCPGD